MYDFVFLRHAESEGNRSGQFQGQFDFPLSENGIVQAKEIAEKWKEEHIHFDEIISSPLLRARTTAEIIQQALDCPIRLETLWMERNMGILQGLDREQAAAAHPRPAHIDLYDPIAKTGESEWQFFLRAGHALQALFSNPPGKYLVVSHGGILNKTLHAIFGIKPHEDFKGIHFNFGNTYSAHFQYLLEQNRWQMLSHQGLPHRQRIEDLPDQRCFTFLRHGESEGNANQIFQGQVDFPLTAKGRSQAADLAQIWADQGKKFDRIIASPQTRAHETAEIIAKQLGLPVHENPIWKEVHNGALGGLSVGEIEIKFPARVDRTNPYAPIGSDGESWWQLYLRAGQAIQELMAYPPGNTLVVSHGAILNAALWSILGISPQPSRRSSVFILGNTSYIDLVYNPQHSYWQFLGLHANHSLPQG